FCSGIAAQPRRPAALAGFGDLIRSHADPRPGPRMRSAARSRREAEDAMTESSADHTLARRAILKGASLGVGAGLVSALTAQAHISAAGAAQASDGAIWSAEYWAKKVMLHSPSGASASAHPRRASRRFRFYSWCTAPRTPHGRPMTSRCRARASTRS